MDFEKLSKGADDALRIEALTEQAEAEIMCRMKQENIQQAVSAVSKVLFLSGIKCGLVYQDMVLVAAMAGAAAFTEYAADGVMEDGKRFANDEERAAAAEALALPLAVDAYNVTTITLIGAMFGLLSGGESCKPGILKSLTEGDDKPSKRKPN